MRPWFATESRPWLDRILKDDPIARSCGRRSIPILHGILEKEIEASGRVTSHFLCRRAPTYYGMMSVAFNVTRSNNAWINCMCCVNFRSIKIKYFSVRFFGVRYPYKLCILRSVINAILLSGCFGVLRYQNQNDDDTEWRHRTRDAIKRRSNKNVDFYFIH